jgi:hypothetical protein
MILDGKPVSERFELSREAGWEAAIVPGPNAAELAWVGNIMQLNLSQADCQRLAAGDAKGIYFRREGSAPLRYFVEKDFPCAHPRVADAMETPGGTFDPPADFKCRKAAGDETRDYHP